MKAGGLAFGFVPVSARSNEERGWDMKRLALAAALGSALAVTAVPSAHAAAPPAPADRILFNAGIVTMDEAHPAAQAIAIRGSEIVAVGTNAAVRRLAGPRTVLTDLRGRTVVPGVIDTHIHAIRGGQSFTFESYWYEQTTLDGALRSLQSDAAKRGAGKWVAVTGAWHPDQFAEHRAPTVDDLSKALPDNPAYVQYLYDYALVNARGIEALGLDTDAPLPPGIVVERGPDGKATGRLQGGIGPFSALFARIGARGDAEVLSSLKAFFNELNQQGVTGLVDAAAGNHTAYTPIFKLWRDQALSLRIAYRASAVAPGNEAAALQSAVAVMPPLFGDGMLKFLGVGEALVFGMNDGVRMGPGFAPPQAAKDELLKVARFAAERGYPLEVHAYTDDCAKAILDVFEEVARTQPIRDLRWAITHINTGTEDTFKRMRALGMFYTVQMGPYFEAPAIRDADSLAVAEASPPTRLALRQGMMVAGGTDSTRIGVVNVWRAIEYHITGRSVGGVIQRRADYLLSRTEALRLYTANAAWVTADEAARGTLAPGKRADLAVLDGAFMTMPADRIHTIRSVLTMVDGKVVFERAKQAAQRAPLPSSLLQAVAAMQSIEERFEAEGVN